MMATPPLGPPHRPDDRRGGEELPAGPEGAPGGNRVSVPVGFLEEGDPAFGRGSMQKTELLAVLPGVGVNHPADVPAEDGGKVTVPYPAQRRQQVAHTESGKQGAPGGASGEGVTMQRAPQGGGGADGREARVRQETVEGE